MASLFPSQSSSWLVTAKAAALGERVALLRRASGSRSLKGDVFKRYGMKDPSLSLLVVRSHCCQKNSTVNVGWCSDDGEAGREVG